jgi:hypothetical protein
MSFAAKWIDAPVSLVVSSGCAKLTLYSYPVVYLPARKCRQFNQDK